MAKRFIIGTIILAGLFLILSRDPTRITGLAKGTVSFINKVWTSLQP